MNHWPKWLLGTVLTIPIGMVGCESDFISIPEHNQQTDATPEPEGGDDTVDIECETICTENEKACDGKDILICKLDDVTKCLNWNISETCGKGQICDAETLDCKNGCLEHCDDFAHQKRCTLKDMEECTDEDKDCEQSISIEPSVITEQCKPDENGCASWEELDKCEVACDSTTGTCVQPCEVNCTEGEQKCEGNDVLK